MTNRRDFIRIAGIAGAGMMSTGMYSCKQKMPFAGTLEAVNAAHKQRFNMCGYAAPKVETVRIGIIGIGRRGIHGST